MSRKRRRKTARKERASADAAAPAATPPARGVETESPPAARRRLTPYDHFRENFEALIVAIILAVIIRQFAVEAFEIPTGSMAPTLYGIHAWTTCPNCDTRYNMALRTDSVTSKITVPYESLTIYEGPCKNPAGCGMKINRVQPGGTVHCRACDYSFRGDRGKIGRANVKAYDSRCPICHFEFPDLLKSSNYTGGHKILVTKFAYAVGEPQRWDVIVFTYDQWKNYIKRLVGKPGERIDVWDGDLYVNGAIERKYRHPYIQDVLWVKIADSSVKERGLRGYGPAWEEVPPSGAGREKAGRMLASWNNASLRWSVNAPGDVAALEYRREFDNYYSYNLLQGSVGGKRGRPQSVQVGDKRVEFVVKPLQMIPQQTARKRVDGSWVGAEIRDGEYTFRVRIPVGSADPSRPAVLERMTTDEGELPNPLRRAYASPPLAATADVALRTGQQTHVVFENVDDRAAVYIDGELVLELEYTSLPEGADFGDGGSMQPLPSEFRGAHYVRLFVADSQVELSDIRVFRDMYYIGRWNVGRSDLDSSIQLKDGQYFALGDNGPSSSDGRVWGYVPESHLMGKAFSVFWPAWPTNFQCKFIR